MYRLCVRDMQKSAGPVYTTNGWQFLFVVEEPWWFGLWSHQHTGLILVCDNNLKHKWQKKKKVDDDFHKDSNGSFLLISCVMENNGWWLMSVWCLPCREAASTALHLSASVTLSSSWENTRWGQITEAEGITVWLKYQRTVCIVLIVMLTNRWVSFPDGKSKSNTAVQSVTCLNVSPQQFTSPDSDLGCFSKPHGALEARVNLSHLHGSFKADHLQSTVTKI